VPPVVVGRIATSEHVSGVPANVEQVAAGDDVDTKIGELNPAVTVDVNVTLAVPNVGRPLGAVEVIRT